MTEMQNFVMWFLTQLPAFFLAEPICYLVGFAFLLVVIRLFRELCRIS